MGSLRILLALAVLLSHMPLAPLQFLGGGLAVQLFYIVSGFYMALVLDTKYHDRGLFYSNRLLRLLPAYAVMMCVAALPLFAWDASATAGRALFPLAFSDPLTAVVLALENLLIVGQELLFWFRIDADGALLFDAAGALPDEQNSVAWQGLLVPQSWSLSMELLFYLCAPFLARLSTRALLLWAAASIGLRWAGMLLPVNYGLWQGRLFPTALFLFVLGMLAYRLLPWAARWPSWLRGASLPAAAALVVGLPWLSLPPEAARWVAYAAVTLLLPALFHLTGRWRMDRWLGELSYPVYLSHLAVIGVVLHFEPPAGFWVALAGTLALSVALLLLVDVPVDRWRQRRFESRARWKRSPTQL
jgi:peptidoglycan/LPS O-acetylase OafA/YrhL